MDKLTDSEILKGLELLIELVLVEGCSKRAKTISNALNLINRLQAENEDLFYKLTGVMHSVDKWLDGDELKQDEVNRAATMREKTLQIVEYAQKAISLHNADIKRAKSEAYKEFAERLKEKKSVYNADDFYWIKYIPERAVDNLLKELVGDDNASE